MSVEKKQNNKNILKYFFIFIILFVFIASNYAYFYSERYSEETVQTLAPAKETLAPASVSSMRPFKTKITNLRKEFSNDDIIGFLEIEGTNIYYPVVQTTDNEFYLINNIYGESDPSGAIFMDFENSVLDLNDNTVIYGHNMRNGTMFHDLRYYLNKDYYESHPFISLTTLYEETIWEIFAFYETTTDFYYIETNLSDSDSFSKLLSQMKSKSIYDTGVDVSIDDKILTLSTCANKGGDYRYVLNARLFRD